MNKQVSLVILEGGTICGHLEKQIQMVRQALVFDLIDRAREAGYNHIVVGTSYTELADALQFSKVDVFLDQSTNKEPFHFGQRLQGIVNKYDLKKVLYMGGASAPLISSSELKYIKEVLEQNEDVFMANNYYSADIVGFTPGKILNRVSLPMIDNSLPLSLGNDGGLRFLPMQRTLGLNFDVDTPTDILIMSVHPNLGSHSKKVVETLSWDLERYKVLKNLLNDPRSELVIYGRVGSNLFQYLDQNTRCRIRLYSEERGMKALGRDLRGEVKTLMGELARTLGFKNFFEFLSQIANGAVLDTRVLFEHFQWKLSQADRFASDLGEVDLIEHAGLREFTLAAINAPIPILLGGHSLVTGGLWALIDAKEKGTG